MSKADAGWQPEETAPTDGRYFLAWDGIRVEMISCWQTQGGKFLLDNLNEFDFYLWHELPDLPASIR